MAERYELRGLATTFDAQLGPGQLPAHPECRSQLAHAGVIVLTKTDVASAAELAAARACLAKARPDARVLVSAQASVSAQALLDALAGRDETPHELHDHDHHHHGHVHAVHTEGVSSAFASLSGGDEAQLRARLSGALARHGDAILRLKGLVQAGVLHLRDDQGEYE